MTWAIIIGVILALAHKSSQQGTSASGTTITVGNPSFGTVAPAQDAGLSREPTAGTFGDWQNGPFVPVPTGSRQDYYATGAARSDSAVSQIAGLRVINPDQGPQVGGGSGGTSAVSGGGGATSGGGSGSGGSTGGQIGGGGFAGRGGGLK